MAIGMASCQILTTTTVCTNDVIIVATSCLWKKPRMGSCGCFCFCNGTTLAFDWWAAALIDVYWARHCSFRWCWCPKIAYKATDSPEGLDLLEEQRKNQQKSQEKAEPWGNLLHQSLFIFAPGWWLVEPDFWLCLSLSLSLADGFKCYSWQRKFRIS